MREDMKAKFPVETAYLMSKHPATAEPEAELKPVPEKNNRNNNGGCAPCRNPKAANGNVRRKNNRTNKYNKQGR